jgi:hypothetical protein
LSSLERVQYPGDIAHKIRVSLTTSGIDQAELFRLIKLAIEPFFERRPRDSAKAKLSEWADALAYYLSGKNQPESEKLTGMRSVHEKIALAIERLNSSDLSSLRLGDGSESE